MMRMALPSGPWPWKFGRKDERIELELTLEAKEGSCVWDGG